MTDVRPTRVENRTAAEERSVGVWGGGASRGRGVAVLCTAVLLVASPAAAQTEPYPPVDPAEPDASVECELQSHPGVVTAGCTGQGLDPDGELVLEVTLDDGPPIATDRSDVDADQTARGEVEVECDDLDGDTIEVTGSSEDPAGQPVVGSASGDVASLCAAHSPAPGDGTDGDSADGDGADVGGTDVERDGAGGSETPGAGTGGLAFTGQDIGLLVMIALLLLLAGYGLTRDRTRRPA